MNFAQPLTQLKRWVKSIFKKTTLKPEFPKSQTFEFHSANPIDEPDKPRATKAYADQRQKAPHNRRRKPSKAMRRLYHLR